MRRNPSRNRRLTSLSSLAAHFVEWTTDVGFSEYTASIRKHALQTFVHWCIRQGIRKPAHLKPAVIEEYQVFIGRYRTASGAHLMANTQATRLNPVKAFCKWLARRRIVKNDPAAMLVLPRVSRRLPSYVPTELEVRRVCELPDTASAAGVRDRAILELLYSSAIRRLELTKLKVGDFQGDRSVVWIRDGKGGKDRIVPVGPRAARWIQTYLDRGRTQFVRSPSDDALFLTDLGEPFINSRLGNLVKRYLNRGGIPGRGSCHMFRHACATHMLENGADIRFIQELLGHSSLSTTQIYTRVAITKLKEAHAKYHPTGGPLKHRSR